MVCAWHMSEPLGQKSEILRRKSENRARKEEEIRESRAKRGGNQRIALKKSENGFQM